MIIGQKTFEDRVSVLEYLVAVAHELIRLSNFFSLEVFSNAISSREIRRAGDEREDKQRILIPMKEGEEMRGRVVALLKSLCLVLREWKEGRGKKAAIASFDDLRSQCDIIYPSPQADSFLFLSS
jgi:hypothetical protein